MTISIIRRFFLLVAFHSYLLMPATANEIPDNQTPSIKQFGKKVRLHLVGFPKNFEKLVHAYDRNKDISRAYRSQIVGNADITVVYVKDWKNPPKGDKEPAKSRLAELPNLPIEASIAEHTAYKDGRPSKLVIVYSAQLLSQFTGLKKNVDFFNCIAKHIVDQIQLQKSATRDFVGCMKIKVG